MRSFIMSPGAPDDTPRHTAVLRSRWPPSRLLSQTMSFWPNSSKGQEPPPLVKTCQAVRRKQSLRMRNWGEGQSRMLQLLSWNRTWTCGAAPQLYGVGRDTEAEVSWHRDHTSAERVQAAARLRSHFEKLLTFVFAACRASSHRGRTEDENCTSASLSCDHLLTRARFSNWRRW